MNFKVRNMRTRTLASLLLIVMTLMTAGMLAQNSSTGDLRGVVKDPSGAVLANATVTVSDPSRNIERSASTDAQGNYSIPLLPPGVYTVSVSAPNFAKVVLKDVRVTIGQTASVPVAVKLQGTTTDVTVTGQPDLIERDRTAVTTTIDQKRIENLPINERNYLGFAMTSSQVDRDNGRPIGPAPTSGLNIGGTRGRSTLVQVDGADNTDTSINASRSTLSQEAVQEFQVITNSYAAEYGRASGGVINVVSKSGTNDLHGSLFGFLRNRKFEAKNHFSPVSDPPYTRTQYGASLGGALVKDKTFFFAAFEQRRRHESGFFTSDVTSGLTSSVTIPGLGTIGGLTAAQAATVNALLPAGGATAQAATCYAVLAGGATATALTGTNPYPAIPGCTAAGLPAFAPVGARFELTGAPVANVSSVDAAGNPLGFRPLLGLQKIFPIKESTTFTSLRLDHKFTDNQQLNFRVGFNPSELNGIQVESQNQSLGQNDYSRTGRQGFHDWSAVTGLTSVLSNTMINEARFNFGRRAAFFRSQVNDSVAANISGAAFFGRELFSPVTRVEKRFEFTDNFTKIAGPHSMRFGGDFAVIPIDASFQLNFAGLYNFGGLDTFPGFPNTFPGISPVQQYGIGIPSNYIQGFGNPKSSLKNIPTAWFAQDSWKALPNLTINYGIRYDIEFTQKFKTTGVTDPFSGITMSAAQIQAAQDAVGVQQGIPLDKNNIAPRLALAWDPFSNGKTVVRAAYGIFFDHPLQAIAFNSDIADSSQQQQAVLLGGSPSPTALLNAAQIFQGTAIAGVTPGLPISTEYQPGRQRFNDQTFVGFGPVLPFTLPVTKNFQYPYANQVNLTIERELSKDISISAGYLMVGAHHLNRPIDINAPDLNLIAQNYQRFFGAAPASTSDAEGFSIPVTAPGGTFTNGGSTWVTMVPGILVVNAANGQKVINPAAANFFRPSAPNYFLVQGLTGGAVTPAVLDSLLSGSLRTPGVLSPYGAVDAQSSNASSNYNAFNVDIKKRFSRQFQFLASYTWSHAIDESSDLQTLLLPQDNRNLPAERADSIFDQRHRFVFSGFITSPDSWRASDSTMMRVLADFSLAPILEISSGRPFNILSNVDTNGDQSNQTDRPSVGPNGVLVIPPQFSTGNLGRDKGILPGYSSLDMRVTRGFHLTDKLMLNAIAEGFNLFNRTNYASASPFFSDVNAYGKQAGGGKYYSRPTAAFDPRQFQFGLRLAF